MATLTEISKRATAHADKYEHNHRAHFTSYYAGATEQDRIARAEERERCIKVMQDWYCKNVCFVKNCVIIETCCKRHGEIRKAIEEG